MQDFVDDWGSLFWVISM